MDLLRALLPCPGCGRRPGGPRGACASCWRRFVATPPGPAPRSASPLPRVVALGPYRGGLGRLVRAAKYRPDRRLLRALGTELGARVRVAAAVRPASPAWWVVPVPADRRRARRRGVDHAALLAAAVAAGWGAGAAMRPGLRRTRSTRPQAGASDAARRRNVAGAIAWRGGPAAGRSVLLVDDVLTTGATARACAAALRAAGAAEVWVAVVARAR